MMLLVSKESRQMLNRLRYLASPSYRRVRHRLEMIQAA